jgi:hypothetical protein
VGRKRKKKKARRQWLYRPEDSEIEVANMKDGIVKMVVSPSIWGHWASGPGDSKENIKWLNEGLQELGF